MLQEPEPLAKKLKLPKTQDAVADTQQDDGDDETEEESDEAESQPEAWNDTAFDKAMPFDCDF